MNIKKACKILNEAILKKEPGFLDIVNLTMNQIYQEGGQLYWDRDIFIDCNCDREVMRDLVRKSDNVFFEPSDDPGEHPGVVVRYKRLHKYDIGNKFKNNRSGIIYEVVKILPDINGSIYTLKSPDERLTNCCEVALAAFYEPLDYFMDCFD